jgi:hypothetical protein
MYQDAERFSYYYANKSIPIGSITACAADAANPGNRKNADLPGEELYTFKLSTQRTCDGRVSLSVTCDQDQARLSLLSLPLSPSLPLELPVNSSLGSLGPTQQGLGKRLTACFAAVGDGPEHRVLRALPNRVRARDGRPERQ